MRRVSCSVQVETEAGGAMMNQIQSVSAQEAHTRARDGIALLICAYESDEKFSKVHLDGAISLRSFQAELDSIDDDKELIFYCA